MATSADQLLILFVAMLGMVTIYVVFVPGRRPRD